MQDSAMDYDNYPEVDEIRNDLAATEEGGDIKVYNTLSPRDKLRAAWHMAKGVADLHGYVNGVIVHQDIQLSQFLLSKDTKRIKLNDFNRAEFMLWDEEGQEYCQYSSGAAHGNVSCCYTSIFECAESTKHFLSDASLTVAVTGRVRRNKSQRTNRCVFLGQQFFGHVDWIGPLLGRRGRYRQSPR